MKSGSLSFVVRWAVNSLGLWVATRLFSGFVITEHLKTFLWVGLLLSFINALLKPITVILALPAVVLTLGLFMLVINGFMLVIVDKISSRLTISSFGTAILAGIIIALVNWLVSTILDQEKAKSEAA